MKTATDMLLEHKGYHEFSPSRFDSDGIDTKFQKRFDDENGKKYFITVDKWREWTHPHTGETFPPAYEFNTQFTAPDDFPINVQCFAGCTIEQAEEMMEKIWQNCGMEYYERWEDS